MHFINRSFCLWAVMVLAFFLHSCKEAEDYVVYKLTVSENSVAFASGGGTKSIEVLPFPEDEAWEATVSDPKDWFSFEVRDRSLSVTSDPNQSQTTRKGFITLTSPQGRFKPIDISVCQEASYLSEVSLSVSAVDYCFDSEGGEYIFTVKTDADWSVSTESEWLSVAADKDKGLVTVTAGQNISDSQLSAEVTVTAGSGSQAKKAEIAITQGTRAENPYYKFLGSWEIAASKWFYSPNGSLNSLDYNPNPTDYYLIFDIEEGEYGKTLVMKDFLYPGTSLEIRFDKETGGIVIPFGWTVYSYDVFMYITLVGTSQFSYASLEVEGAMSEDGTVIDLEMPSVDGFSYVGFGLWTYNDDGDKVAVGSRYMPTMFPMGDIVFRKQSL